MPNWFSFRAFINYWLDAVDEHSIHSPYFFEFYNKVINSSVELWGTEEIEKVRKNMLTNPYSIEVTELGSGSPLPPGKQKLSAIARMSLAKPHFAHLYGRIIRHIKAENIIELGTSLGITTLYLAMNNDSKVFTLEGNKSVADVAQTNFEFFEKKNINLIVGNIDKTLKDTLSNIRRVDFALIDANHRYEPATRYFDLISKRVSEKSIVVIDDIHRSKEMSKAWVEIKKNNLVYGSVDLFQCGLVFFEPSLNKQHLVCEFKAGKKGRKKQLNTEAN